MDDRRFTKTENENHVFNGGRRRQLWIQLCRLENYSCSCRNSGIANLDEMDKKFDKSTSAYKDKFQVGNDMTLSHMKLQQQHYNCDQRGKSGDTTRDLNLHQEIHKNKTEKSTAAGKRNLTPTSTKSVAMAMAERLKSPGKSFICPLCTKVLKGDRFHLEIHIRSHTKEKPYFCPVCNKGFARSLDVTRHKVVHSGEKPYVCPICSKGFNQQGNLKIHKMTHTGEKPYVCTVCSKGFALKGNLRRHQRKHTKHEKP